MENKFHFIDLYYPYQIEQAYQYQKDPELYQYESLHLNMYTSVDYLNTHFQDYSTRIFEYRIKGKNVTAGVNSYCDQVPWVSRQYSFEINAYNISGLTDKSLIIIRNTEDVIMIPENNNSKDFRQQIREQSRHFLKNVLLQNEGKFLVDFFADFNIQISSIVISVLKKFICIIHMILKDVKIIVKIFNKLIKIKIFSFLNKKKILNNLDSKLDNKVDIF